MADISEKALQQAIEVIRALDNLNYAEEEAANIIINRLEKEIANGKERYREGG